MAISIVKESIYSYIDTITHGKYTKKFFIRGFPGSGKTWCMDYIFLYKMACALKAITTVIMDKHSIQLVGCHWHKIFCIPIENNMNTYIKSYLYILKLLLYPKRMEIVITTYIFFCGKFGKLGSDLSETIDIIIRKVRD